MFSSSPPPTANNAETSRIKSFMGRTPAIGILKSKFLTVLGNSNELLNGISSKVTTFRFLSLLSSFFFTFSLLVEVPGCDPYREYLCTFLREQPIWLSLRFWNAAFLECMELERNNRLQSRQKKQERRKAKEKAKDEATKLKPPNAEIMDNEEKPSTKQDISDSSSSHHSQGHKTKKDRAPKTANEAALDVDKEMENIAFRQLATFTSNIHALGAPQDLCLEFFKKQQSSVGLSKEKSKLIRDNVHRIYYETEIWGSKQS
uniref:SBF1/SBF2 domain-containing protein n=1 Tax=Stomoxys calcitrans TaxID=35570 RepID=A0A1I8PRN7_STOCA|nr:unnamed protein product [Stomoxys calcitrans]